jgi:hypothetical protein
MKMLQQHLAKRFGAIHAFRRFVVPVSLLTFKINGNALVVALKAWKKFGQDEWYASVDPLEYPKPVNLPEEGERKYAKDLMLVSEEIHALLSTTTGVTRLRWFFAGWDAKRPGVGTPAKLPWHVDIRELREAQSRM